VDLSTNGQTELIDEFATAFRLKKAGGVTKLKAELASRGDAMEQ
jgi:hypothetical protein